MTIRILSLLLASSICSFAVTKSVYRVWQPLSLHGTDVASVLGKESRVNYAVLMSRPVVLSGALPEELVYAVSQGHQLASIGGYSEPEANLLALYKVKLDARYDDEQLTVTIDLSEVVKRENADVSLHDTVKLAIEALKKTLQDYGAAYLQSEMACVIQVVGGDQDPKLKALQEFNTRFVTEIPLSVPSK